MEELLRKIIEQNDVLIAQNDRKLHVLTEVLTHVEGLHTQLVLNDASTEISMISTSIQEVVTVLETVRDTLDSISGTVDDIEAKLED